ncbi:UDP-GlcNAc:betaGal beta-1,3-N-acetylglucosaminyltransferase 7-like isoform X1 [Lepisosteus oculatus]|uniref:UDP-GlcNAc:betaGal beta-1,3-N-acetylglucosaminyltransferase 7-like isoform X1 n=2 Tax=Lepisosteus oculatus TaxID=7918 RepID=UPI003719781E
MRTCEKQRSLSGIREKIYQNLRGLILAVILVVTVVIVQVTMLRYQNLVPEKNYQDRQKGSKSMSSRGRGAFWMEYDNGSHIDNSLVQGWDITTVNCSANSSMVSMPWFAGVGERIQRFLLYRHCRYFPMIFNHPEKCREDIYLLMVVKSVITQYKRREAIRRTWGQEKEIRGKKIRLVFLLGTDSKGEEQAHHQKLLEYEDRVFGDILQWDFEDSFYNLTIKEVGFLKWFSIYCQSVPYIFKGDDDVFVNTVNVVEFLESNKNTTDLITGDVLTTSAPNRDRNSKYFIPEVMFSETFYPPYVGGGGFLMGGPLAMRMYGASNELEIFPIDDAFIGLCLRVLQVSPKEHGGIKTLGIKVKSRRNGIKDPCLYRNLLLVHKLTPDELIQMWEQVNSNLICTQSKYIE